MRGCAEGMGVNTHIKDITDELIFNWWHCLKVVQLGGFKFDFAFNHLNRIVDACCVLMMLKVSRTLTYTSSVDAQKQP